LSGALKWLFGLIFENFWWKLAALVIAVTIWALVSSEPELATFATVRLEYRNLPEDLDISSEPVTSVILELQGPTGELRGIGENTRLAVVLEMSDVRPGERTFMIGNGNVRLPRGVRLVRAIPSEVRLRFDPRAEGEIKVIPRFIGAGQSGYVVARYNVNPERLRIAGPSSHVARVSTAVTDPVDVSSAVGSAEYRVNAFVEDPFVHFLSSPRVVITVTMRKR
jgi:hypothetical protein